MPLRTASHSLTRKATKDGRKRTLSTISNTTQPTQAGPAGNSKPNEKGSNGPNKALKSQATTEPPANTKPVEPPKKVPDVFQFLDNDDGSSSESSSASESESESESSEEESPPPVAKQTTTNIQSPKPRTSNASKTLLASANTPPKAPAPPSTRASRIPSDARPLPPPAPPAPVPTENQWQLARKQAPSKSSNAGYYDNSEAEKSPQPSRRQLQISNPENYYTSSRDVPKKRRGGFPPLYRRFGAVNHRVLLYLQDEISQMEEDLEALDEYEEMHRVGNAEKEGTKPMPPSRRLDVQSQAYSSLHYRRMELMAALTQKTEQYNNALSAYSKVLQTLPRASEDDIKNYRSWMKDRNPIAAAETRFLDQDADLVSLSPRLAASAAAAPVYISIFIASGALLLPLLAFSMIAEFSGRLVVVTVTGGAAAAIAANYSSGIDALVDSRDGWRCTMLYFGFMTIAAMFIP
ncbi:hypothetical protein N7533_006736 [Penicillium manginii]|uniref:uncharacterized protein n=1 Tax=Penicillium manginii TaxID=203109 RepID=UPI002548F456|nr:uncharacterized protein N7533_006736 [Penicillium manginii]KAJ5749708.1 hypothetical protein N7533_006736 [Penicillium manginii]